jgi:hypothetical protein
VQSVDFVKFVELGVSCGLANCIGNQLRGFASVIQTCDAVDDLALADKHWSARVNRHHPTHYVLGDE